MRSPGACYRYPWGDRFDYHRCNTSESKIGVTTPVGTYPDGASPCGAQDMVGNVTEWTNSVFGPYPYNANDGREQPSSQNDIALRGCAWNMSRKIARGAWRTLSNATSGTFWYGFRLARSAPNS